PGGSWMRGLTPTDEWHIYRRAAPGAGGWQHGNTFCNGCGCQERPRMSEGSVMTAAVRKRVLVAGGGGFLGTHLCQRLLHAGHQVLCVDNFSSGSRRNLHQLNEFPSFSCIDHDIEQPLTADPVDEIYNFACVASPVQYQ